MKKINNYLNINFLIILLLSSYLVYSIVGQSSHAEHYFANYDLIVNPLLFMIIVIIIYFQINKFNSLIGTSILNLFYTLYFLACSLLVSRYFIAAWNLKLYFSNIIPKYQAYATPMYEYGEKLNFNFFFIFCVVNFGIGLLFYFLIFKKLKLNLKSSVKNQKIIFYILNLIIILLPIVITFLLYK